VPPNTRLRTQALALFFGVASIYAGFSPFGLAGYGYAQETMRACRQLLSPERPRVPPDFGVDWPRNGSTDVFLLCPFQAAGRALGGPDSVWEDRLASMQPVLATAGLVTLVFVWASRLAASRRRAFWLALACGFCTMLWPYAYIGMEPVQSLFLLLAGYLALEAPEPSWKRTAAFSLCAALAVASKSAGAALLPAVLYLAWVLLRRRPLRLAAALVPIAALFLVNNHFRALSWARFGGFGPWSMSTRAPDLVSSAMSAIALLASPNKGLLVFAPLALLGLVLIHRTFRLRADVAVYAFLSLAGPLLLVTQFRIWTDETWGPRYLHCAVAPLLLCLAPPLSGAKPSLFMRGLIGGAAAAGFAVSFLGSMFFYGKLPSVATRSTPTSLQAYQGDPTWNHVVFNARLFRVWWRMRFAGASESVALPAPDSWDFIHPDRRPEWTSVDLRDVAVPQPMILRPFSAHDPPRTVRASVVLLLVGPLLLLFTWRAAAADEEAQRVLEARRALEAQRAALAAAAAAPPPPAPPTPVEIYDGLVGRLGVDPEHPGWFPALRELHQHSRTRRLQVIPDFFYTPVFAPADIPAEAWESTFAQCGTFDLAAQKAFLLEAPSFREELQALPVDPPPADDTSYFWNNEQFSHADAALYYTLLRRLRPKRIVEVGSGHSTKLALEAVRRNGAGSILCVEPHPPEWLRAVPGALEILPEKAQDAPLSLFLGLEPGDVLFIDGSHISKTGSDVNHLFLRVLPCLPAGVIVQIHDICLPFEYPRYWSEDVLCYWNEQYVLAALLANSSKFEVLAGVYFLHKTDPEILRALIPDLPGVMPGGGSLWLRST
jgi:hypothetical protein